MCRPRPTTLPPRTTTAPTTGLGCARPTLSRASSSACCIQPWSSVEWSVKERVNVGLGIEGNQIVDLFTRPDETNGQLQFARNSHHNTTLRCSVQFGEHDARDSRMAPEFASLVEPVLSSGCVENQQHLVRCAGHDFGRGAL